MKETLKNRLVTRSLLALAIVVPAVALLIFFTYTPVGEPDNIAGFAYDEKQDIFYSVLDPWQRKTGYCRLYDQTAPDFNMIIDCEPVYFFHGGKHWLIELWKGQYGITAGGEIGLYNTRNADAGKNPQDLFYQAADNSEMLPMSFILLKNDRPLFSRNHVHWWLTGFKMGEFSAPSELTMEAKITISDEDMREAFTDALKKLGYEENENLRLDKDDVYIHYTAPFSEQPKTRLEAQEKVLEKNKRLCDYYNRTVSDGENTSEDKLEELRKTDPAFYYEIVSAMRFFPVDLTQESDTN